MIHSICRIIQNAQRNTRRTRRNRARRRVHVESLEPRVLLAAGDYDPTFDDNGVAQVDFDESRDFARDIVVRPDGGSIAVGWTREIAASLNDFAMAAFDADGSPDTSFDVDGRKAVNFSLTDDGASQDYAYAAALQSDGKIVVAGQSNSSAALLRLHPNGSLDTTFGSNGTGKIVLTGPFGGTHTFRLIRDIEVDPDDRIVVIGSSHDGNLTVAAMARFEPDGNLDNSFSSNGFTTIVGLHTPSSGYAVTSDQSSYVVAVSRTFEDTNIAVSRVGFEGQTGIASIVPVPSSPRSIDIQLGGRVVVAGEVDGQFAVLRFLPIGDVGFTLDSDFDADGIAVVEFSNPHSVATSVVVQGAKIVAGGTIGAGGDPLDGQVVRFHGDGSLDLSFAEDGSKLIEYVEPDLQSSPLSTVESVALGNGKILVAGIQLSPTPKEDFGMARLINDVSVFLGPTGLVVNGSDNGNEIDVFVTPQIARVVLDGERFEFITADIPRGGIEIDGAGGNDTVDVRIEGDLPFASLDLDVDAGRGWDTVNVLIDSTDTTLPDDVYIDGMIVTAENFDAAYYNAEVLDFSFAASIAQQDSGNLGADDLSFNFQGRARQASQTELVFLRERAYVASANSASSVDPSRQRMETDRVGGGNRVSVSGVGFDDAAATAFSGSGDDVLEIGLLIPAIQKVQAGSSRLNIDLGDGANDLTLNVEGYHNTTTEVIAGTGDDVLEIALLVPVVQKVRDTGSSWSESQIDLGGGSNELTLNAVGYATTTTNILTGDDDRIVFGTNVSGAFGPAFVGGVFVAAGDIPDSGQRGRISLSSQRKTASLSLENLNLSGPAEVNIAGFSEIRRDIKGVRIGGSYAESIIPLGNVLIISEDGNSPNSDDGTNGGENYVFLSLGWGGGSSQIDSSGSFVSQITGGSQRNHVVSRLENVINRGGFRQSINTGRGRDAVVQSIDGFENYGTATFDTRLGRGADHYLLHGRDIYIAPGASLDLQVDGNRGRDTIFANITATLDGEYRFEASGGRGSDTIGVKHRLRTRSVERDDSRGVVTPIDVSILIHGDQGHDQLASWLFARHVDEQLIDALIDGGRGKDRCRGNVDVVNCER